MLDEAVSLDASTVHIEMMGDREAWLGVDCLDGSHYRFCIWVDGKHKLRFGGEMDAPPRQEEGGTDVHAGR